MPVKNHRRNTHFQIEYFLAGACHTPDGRYSQLCELREEREQAIASYAQSKIVNRAKVIRAKRIIKWCFWDEAKRLEAQSIIREIQNGEEMAWPCYEAGVAELEFIKDLIDEVQPRRKYKHLPDPEAHEAAQREEWKLELLHRCRLSVAAVGFIPADTLSAVYMHPDWPTLREEVVAMLPENQGIKLMLTLGPHKPQKIDRSIEQVHYLRTGDYNG